MAKEIREIIAQEEKLVADAENSREAIAWLESLRSIVDFGRRKRYLHTSLPEIVQKEVEAKQRQDPLKQAVAEFNRGPLTPELVTATFQTIWTVRGESAGLEIVVSPCDRTVEELAELVKAGRRTGYLPEQVMTQEERPLLAKMFPHLGSHSVREGNSVTNEANRFGWFDYEASIDAPYRKTNEEQLRSALKAEATRLGRDLVGMNVNEYIVASEDSKLLTGKYLDQGSIWARLLGSRDDGEVVCARFDPGGDLLVSWYLGPSSRYPDLGGRSVGVKRA